MLKRRAFVATVWSIVEWGGSSLLATIFILILARFLTPADFGVFAASTFVTGLASQIAVLGLDRTLVQRDKLDWRVASTAIWITLVLSLSMCAIISLMANTIAIWFGDARVAVYLPYFAGAMVVGSGAAVFSAMLRRDLQMKAIAKRTLIANLVGGTVAVVLATRGFGVTALVVQAYLTASINLALAWVFLGRPLMVVFDWPTARSLVTFGMPVSGANLMDFMGREGPKLFVGVFLGTAALGIFAMALRISTLLVHVCVLAVDRVTLPVLSQINRTTGRVREAYFRLVRLTTAMTLPVFASTIVLREEMVVTFLGPRWIEAATPLAFLAGGGIVIAANVLNDTALVAIGRPGARLWYSVMRAAIGIALLVAMARFGLIYAAAAVLLRGLITEPIVLHYLLLRIGGNLRTYLAHVQGSVFALVVLAAAGLGARAAMEGFPVATVLVIAGVTCFVSFFVAIRVFDPTFAEEFRALIVPKRGKEQA